MSPEKTILTLFRRCGGETLLRAVWNKFTGADTAPVFNLKRYKMIEKLFTDETEKI
jgi:hypothetical protein